jgi:cysteine desulfurase
MGDHDLIYLDYNASTPVCKEAAEAMASQLPFPAALKFTPNWLSAANPSSAHAAGKKARILIQEARNSVQKALNCGDGEGDKVVFTSGGTESNNWAIFGAVEAAIDALGCPENSDNKRRIVHVVCSAVEHPSVLEAISSLTKRWSADGPMAACTNNMSPIVEATLVPCDSSGVVSPEAVAACVKPETCLVSVMLANNEVGTVQPLAEIARAVRLVNPRSLIHTDASQAVGKVVVDVEALGVDLLTCAGHKFYATRGIGCLFMRRKCQDRVAKFMHGGGHEFGLRAGTENSILIAGFGAAIAVASDELEGEAVQLHALRRRLLAAIRGQAVTAGAVVNALPDVVDDEKTPAHLQPLLPNTLSVSLPGVSASALIEDVGERLCITAGSACHANLVTMSPVLAAMGMAETQARGTLRISVGRYTTEEEVDEAALIIAEAASRQLG